MGTSNFGWRALLGCGSGLQLAALASADAQQPFQASEIPALLPRIPTRRSRCRTESDLPCALNRV
eukprot:2084186-Rhodomonas_salina.2